MSSEYLNFEFNDRFHRNRESGVGPRFRQLRGRPLHYRDQTNQHSTHHNRGSHFRQNFRQLVNDFSHQSISPSISPSIRPSISKTKAKPKYETIVLELADNSNRLTEDTLKQHFQQTYGTIKKIWFNNTRSKAFITFFNHMSADMCLESGDYVRISGLSVKVYPLPVTMPKELLSSNEDISFKLKTLCKSNNRNLKAMFPSKNGSDPRHPKKSEPNLFLNRNELLNLVKIQRIDEKKLLSDVLKADDINGQIDVLFRSILLRDADVKRRNQMKEHLQEVLNSNGFECRLHFIGSTVNSLGFRDSDIDIFIETFGGKQKTFDETMDSLKTIHKILKRSLKMFIPPPFASPRCPIVRLDFNESWLVKNSGCEALVCDLSLSNGLARRNSRLIDHYCQLEPRFRQLCLLLRFWAKLNGFVGSSHMSAYALTQLVLFFCQKEDLLPTLDSLRQPSDTEKLVVNGWDCSFSEDLSIFSDNQRNNDSILELLEKFFAFYANFNFSHLIIRTKSGLTKQKSDVLSEMDTTSGEEAPNDSFKLTPIISIEDPFILTHNLCENLNYKTFDKFCDYLSNISLNFKQIFVEKCEQNVSKTEETQQKLTNNFWGLSSLCREWDPTPNGYAFPDQYIGYANIDLILSPDSSQSPTVLMQLMANRLIDLTDLWLSKVYCIESLLVSKWQLICGHLSPFVEFYIKVRGLDSRAIDSNTRQETRKQFTEEELKELSFTDLETQITDRIHRQFNSDVNNSNVVPIDCQFGLVMNCRTTFPTVELVLIDFKPQCTSSKALKSFLRRLIAKAAKDARLLTCPYELTSQ